jgi:integrase
MPLVLSKALTEEKIKRATPRERPHRLVDGAGLQLTVAPSGRKTFELRLQIGGRDRMKTLGAWPEMTLAKARQAAEKARTEARESPESEKPSTTFASAFDQWYRANVPRWTDGYARDVYRRLDLHATPALGKRPIAEIKRADVLALLEKISARGAREQARRVRALLHDVFEHAVTRELREDNPAPKSLLKLLPRRPKVEGHAAAAFEDMPDIVRAIRAYRSTITSAAMLFTIYTAARTTEVRKAEWSEIDLDEATWSVPAERMKSGRPHLVPLSQQAVALLKSLPRASERWVFPTLRKDAPLSENAMLYALAGMGIEGATMHGFRSTFSTWGNDRRIAEPDIIESALAHVVPGVRGAYDRGTRFDARRKLMQQWADAIEPRQRRKK